MFCQVILLQLPELLQEQPSSLGQTMTLWLLLELPQRVRYWRLHPFPEQVVGFFCCSMDKHCRTSSSL
jgi:hypothetical protein